MTQIFQIVENDIVIADGYSRSEAITEATAHFESLQESECDFTETYTLRWEDDAGEHEETVPLRIIIENDNGDGGRFDYLAGIGAI